MRMYDVYRYDDLVARVRVRDRGKIEWAYRQEEGNWQGFWWCNDVKGTIDEIIQKYQELEELVVAEFTLRRSGPTLSNPNREICGQADRRLPQTREGR
jgi:hypothetical protein